MNNPILSNLALTILEIVSQQQDVHILVVKGQIQDMAKITGGGFDNSEFNNALSQLESIEFVQRLPTNSDLLVSTDKGKSYLQSNV
ncbi:MAG: hypothetical protein ACXACP_04535 [Candidatus Hodarchaeales archaeon]